MLNIIYIFGFLVLYPFSIAQAYEPLKISVSRTPLSLPFYVAEKLNFFEEEGLQIEINEVIGGNRTLQTLLEGNADLATTSEAVIMFNSFKHNSFSILTTFVSSTNDVKIISNAEINSPKQLIGKKVATVTGAASQYYLDTLLLLNGIDPKSIQVIKLHPEDMVEALKNKDVDALSIWEPFPFIALKTIPNTKSLPSFKAYRLTFNLVVSNDLIGKRDDDLKRLLNALHRAELFIQTQPIKAQSILKEHLNLEQEFIDWIWPDYNYRLTLDQSLLMTLEAEARWARQEAHINSNRTPNYLEFIYSSPLRSIQPSAVNIIE